MTLISLVHTHANRCCSSRRETRILSLEARYKCTVSRSCRYQMVNAGLQHTVADIQLLRHLRIYKNLQLRILIFSKRILQFLVEHSIHHVQTLGHWGIHIQCGRYLQFYQFTHRAVKHILQQLCTGTTDGQIDFQSIAHQDPVAGFGIFPHIQVFPHHFCHDPQQH